ncbi:hypothetical protein J7M07_07760 [bacterium]|nr:hypothetical protein [bacterium]
MLKRFSLYGFLKNQQYYEPFIVLAFLQMGLNYTLIGLLIAFREMMVNIMEIPSGAVADVWGRRKSMIVSFAAYIVHFTVIGSAGVAAVNGLISFKLLLVLLFLSMFFYAVGDAFRTGTHKAMIFTWLRIQGRTNETTAVYGYTRSWSKIGSAVSVVLACFFVYYTRSYVYIFFFSIIPYVLNIINFAGYQKELDGESTGSLSARQVLVHLKGSLLEVIRNASLRRLILESMGFEGFFKSIKDYLQPILKQAALPLIALFFSGVVMTSEQKSVILIGPVYFFLFILSALASRKSHKLVRKTGGEDSTARLIWLYMLFMMILLVPAMYFRIYWAMIAGFIALYILQNLWRPVLISRFDTHCSEAQGATVLSIESQAKSVGTMLIAPLMGAAVDFVKYRQIGKSEFWPVAVAGLILSGLFFVTAVKSCNETE